MKKRKKTRPSNVVIDHTGEIEKRKDSPYIYWSNTNDPKSWTTGSTLTAAHIREAVDRLKKSQDDGVRIVWGYRYQRRVTWQDIKEDTKKLATTIKDFLLRKYRAC